MLTYTSYVRPFLLVLVPLGIGILARKTKKLDHLFKGIYVLVLWAVLPALVFGSVAIQRPDQMYDLGGPVVLALIGLGTTSALATVITHITRADREESIAVFLNSSFMNYTFLGLGVVYVIGGALPDVTAVEALGMASIYAVTMGVAHLTVGVALAASSSSKEKPSLRSITLSILTFPAAFALIVALLFVGFNVGWPIKLQSQVDTFANPAVFLMLLVAGYHMLVVNPRKYLPTISLVGVIRLLICPLVTYGVIILAGVGQTVAATALVLAAMPPGVFNVILAEKFDLDLELYSATVFYLTLISLFVSIPLIVHFFMGVSPI